MTEGYQKFDWMSPKNPTHHQVILDDVDGLRRSLKGHRHGELYLYTQHRILYEDGVLQQTRSSPNWEGGMVTYTTCKHHMRTYKKATWVDLWIAGMCPKECADNCLLFVGKVGYQFPANYLLYGVLQQSYPEILRSKRASANPRGDLYTPKRRLLSSYEWFDHHNFIEPKGHTRSVEYYSKSPGSVSDRGDGRVPKWWRDLEYLSKTNRRPPVFILQPCYIFSTPMVWSSLNPGRANLRTTCGNLLDSLGGRRSVD